MNRKQRRGGAPRTVDPTGKQAATVRLVVAVTPTEHARLAREAKQQQVTLSELVRRTLRGAA
jgi:predicted HicB family RNase H-like nuclease